MTKGEMIQEYYDKAVELAAYCENDDLNHYDLDVQRSRGGQQSDRGNSGQSLDRR